MAHGAFAQSSTIVTAYETLGVEGLQFSLRQTESKIIFVDVPPLPTLAKALDKSTTIHCVILNDQSSPNEEEVGKFESEFPDIRVILYSHLQELGRDNPSEHTVPGPDDLACVMYTSGATGTPKGVKITHRAIVASVAGVSSIVAEYIGPGDRLLAYLPQGHIIEFVFENAAIFWGATMGYGSPKTLTDTSVRSCKGDLLEFTPSIMVGVPAVWESIRKSIVDRVNSSGMISKKLFWAALYLK